MKNILKITDNLPGKCYCGHDCSRCITYCATISNDEKLKTQAQEFYKNQFGYDVSIDEVHCLGGRSSEIFVLCKDCPFIKCCREKNIAACVDCELYPCEKISGYEKEYVNKYHQMPESNAMTLNEA